MIDTRYFKRDEPTLPPQPWKDCDQWVRDYWWSDCEPIEIENV